MPAACTLTRMHIRLHLTKAFCEVTKVPFLQGFRAIGHSKLHILDIDRQTVEACAEVAQAEEARKREEAGIVIDEDGPDELLWNSPQIGKLISAGAPGYRLIVRVNGSGFDWRFFIDVSEAINKTAGKDLEGAPLVADCGTSAEAIDRYLSEVALPESWIPIERLVNEGLEIPHHQVLTLYSRDGQYVGRAIHHTGLDAVLPLCPYTDEELARAKVNFFRGLHGENIGLGRISIGTRPFVMSNTIKCDQPVFYSEVAASCLRVKDYTESHSVDPSTLVLLPGLRCGSSGIRWAIDGKRAFLRAGDSSKLGLSYVPTGKWPTVRDFPLLFPLDQTSPDTTVVDSWSDRFRETLLLPPEVLELQKRVTQKISRDASEVRQILSDPDELSALVQLLLNSTSVAQIEKTAELLEASYCDAEDLKSKSDVEDQELRVANESQGVPIGRPRGRAAWQKNYPFISQFGPATQRVLRRETLNALDDSGDGNLPVEVAILVEMIVLASASAASVPAVQFRFVPALLAVGKWAEGHVSLEEVLDLASVYSDYYAKAERLEAKVALVGAAVFAAVDCRERARELKVAYAGERVIVRPSARVGNL